MTILWVLIALKLNAENPGLKRTLTPAMVWGLGVGYVISGNYFGWNLGLEKGGTLGLGVAVIFIIAMYITFTLSYAELACAIPKAGGAFDYANRAFGRDVGFIVGMAQNIEFIFAPPAIAYGIGAYFNVWFPSTSTLTFAIAAYFIFVTLNILGVTLAAIVELSVTIIAVAAIITFSGISLSHFQFSNLASNAWPNGWAGVPAATPFAIWFFLGIEGVANLAEEAVNPRRTILIGFGSAIATLVVLCVTTFLGSVGIAGWEAVVFKPDGSSSDSPLPLALAHLVGANDWKYSAFVGVGLFGLIASFHGLMLAAGRSTYEFGKTGYAPAVLGKAHKKFGTPVNALLINMVLGLVALYTGKTAEIITISVFGALTLYIISMLSMIRLRRVEPALDRPFKVPAHPAMPIVALVIASVALTAMIVYYPMLAAIFGAILISSFVIFKLKGTPTVK